MYNKNDKIELTIEDMSVNGEGIGHHNNMAFFVKGAVIGDRIIAGITRVKKSMCYARVVDIIEKSPYRCIEKCDKASPCGGCQLQALDYSKQLELKESHVRNNLIRIGGFDEENLDFLTEPVIGMDEPYYYRNKLQIPVGVDKNGGVVMGFYLSHSHDIVPINKCYLSHPAIENALAIIREWISRERVSVYRKGQGFIRHILIRYGFHTGQIMVCLVGNAKLEEIDTEKASKHSRYKNRLSLQLAILIDKLKDIDGMTSIVFNSNCRNTNVILGDETKLIWGKETITDYIGDKAFNISAKSFYQVNSLQTKKLYDKVAEYAGLTGSENVWDLYCGIGTIGIYLSDKASSVFGVEVVPQAIEDAIDNAGINNIDNVQFVTGKVEDIIRDIRWSNSTGVYKCDSHESIVEEITVSKPDIIVVDPPRKGCDSECIGAILELQPDKVVYVSCNPSTLARDLQKLCESEYKLSKVTPVDMFPQTGHVEVVSLLQRMSNTLKRTITLDVDMEDYHRIKSEGR